jgi:hypothetical protein
MATRRGGAGGRSPPPPRSPICDPRPGPDTPVEGKIRPVPVESPKPDGAPWGYTSSRSIANQKYKSNQMSTQKLKYTKAYIVTDRAQGSKLTNRAEHHISSYR